MSKMHMSRLGISCVVSHDDRFLAVLGAVNINLHFGMIYGQGETT